MISGRNSKHEKPRISFASSVLLNIFIYESFGVVITSARTQKGWVNVRLLPGMGKVLFVKIFVNILVLGYLLAL